MGKNMGRKDLRAIAAGRDMNLQRKKRKRREDKREE